MRSAFFFKKQKKMKINSQCLEIQEKCPISESYFQNNVCKGSDIQCVGEIFFF